MPTSLNLWVLEKIFEAALKLAAEDGTPALVSNRLEVTDAPHVRRCLNAGLVVPTDSFGADDAGRGATMLKLTPAGVEALAVRAAERARRAALYCAKCGLGLAPAQTTETCPRCAAAK